MLRAIVLAAGASSRMGRPKAALPLRDRADTFVSHIVRTLAAAGVPEIVVVTGAAPEAVRGALGRTRRAVRVVQNDGWRSGQLSSLLTGLNHERNDLVEAALVALVDAPLASAATVAQVVARWRRTRAPIVRPGHGAVHGHPVIFDRRVFAALRHADPAVGAKAVVRAHEDEIVNVPIDDPGAFIDVDTEEEYRDVLRDLRVTR